MSAAQITLPDAVGHKLHAVSGRRQMLSFVSGVIRAGAAFLGLILLAMFVDWLVTPFDTGLRLFLTVSVIVAGVSGLLYWALPPWLRRPSLSSIAGMVDAAVPRLEERWTTIADLSQTSDPPPLRGSPALIGQVAAEAEQLQDLVEPHQVVSSQTVRNRLSSLGGVLAALAVAWLADPAQVNVLWQRFWSPTRDISLTTITSPTANTTVPRGEPVTILAVLEQRLRNEATIWVRDESGKTTRQPMLPHSGERGQFALPIDSVNDALEYRIRAGDGQTPWLRIDVADRPRITGLAFRIVPPEYSQLPVIEQQGLPRRTRALEDSVLEMVFQVSEPLKELALVLPDHGTLRVEPSADGTYRLQRVLTEDFSFTPRLISRHELTNEKPPRCDIDVYRDQFPAVSLVTPQEDMVLRPDDTMTVEFTARDDFGIAKAELVVTDPDRPDEPLEVIDIPLNEQAGQPEVQAATQLDLKELHLKNGAKLSYAVRVFDTKDSTGTSRQSSSATAESLSADAKEQQAAAESSSPPSEKQSEPSAADTAQNDLPAKDAAEQSSGDKPSSTTSASASKSAQAAKSKTDEGPQSRMVGAPRPGDEMSRRQLNLGQCTTCKPLNLKIDEWAGTFDGQMREKLEIAIEDYLAKLDAALKCAEEINAEVHTKFLKDSGWSDDQTAGVRKTAGHLTKASQIALDLATKSAGTPYAFMGLQLREIDERHVAEAQLKLDALAQQDAAERNTGLEASLFHIRRARELLAGLSRTYEAVKVNHQIAEAMTRVKQMHQVFVEDTFKLLGSAKPVLNPKQRKFLELDLDEEFRNKLKKLLEQKRDVQAELAKILAERPDLLKRFMANARVDADSLRDQMTLLAQRQTKLRDETQLFLKNDDAESQAAALASLKLRITDEAKDIAQAAALTSENFETWLPDDGDADHEAVKSAREQFELLATLADRLSAATDEETPATARSQQVHDQLQKLETELTQVAEAFPGHSKLTRHIANRRAELAKLTTLVSGWHIKREALEKKDYPLIQLVDQTHLTNATAEATNKIANLRAWMAGLTPEIGELASELNSLLEDDLLNQQVDAEDRLGDNDLKKADVNQSQAVDLFAKAEQQFDKLLDTIIAHLDSLPANTKPTLSDGMVPSLDDLLALLEEEKLAAEGLGIPCCRPTNLSIVQDWLSPSKGSGMGAAMASSASSQSQSAQQVLQRLHDSASKKRNQMLAGSRRSEKEQSADTRRRENPRWNTLASKLEDGLKQARGQSPPQKYRSAIERYFEVISQDATEESKK